MPVSAGKIILSPAFRRKNSSSYMPSLKPWPKNRARLSVILIFRNGKISTHKMNKKEANIHMEQGKIRWDISRLKPSHQFPLYQPLFPVLLTPFTNIVDQIFIGQGCWLSGKWATTVAFPVMTILLAFWYALSAPEAVLMRPYAWGKSRMRKLRVPLAMLFPFTLPLALY